VSRTILHADLDAFYASVEQLDNPELRGKPVVVGGAPEGRGVVAAASYEARRFGVRSAMPMSRALRLCPDAVRVSPRFERYATISRRVMAIFRALTPLVEPLSLDEAYLDVTDNAWNEPLGTQVAKRLKAQIHEATGLTASAGVAPIAIRNPISEVRWLTTYDTRPYRPTTARNAAVSANAPNNPRLKRRAASEASTNSRMLPVSDTAASGSIARKWARKVWRNAAGSDSVLTIQNWLFLISPTPSG